MDEEELEALCEKFLFDHDAAIEATLNYLCNHGLKVTKEMAKICITEMHKYGDFDDVICFSTPLNNNDLYKRFHPDKLATAQKQLQQVKQAHVLALQEVSGTENKKVDSAVLGTPST